MVLTPCPPLLTGEGERRSTLVSPLPKGEGIKGVRTKGEGIKGVRTNEDAADQGWTEHQSENCVHPQTSPMVVTRRARSPVAPHARSVPRARLRVHAAADASEPRGGVLCAVARAVPGSRKSSRRSRARGERSVGRVGVLRARAQPTRPRERRCREKRSRKRRCRRRRWEIA